MAVAFAMRERVLTSAITLLSRYGGSAGTGTRIDSAAAVNRLGPPLDHELAHWFPPADIPAMGERFRALYPDIAIEPTLALPGAR